MACIYFREDVDMTEPPDLFGPDASQADMLMLLLDAFPGQKDGVMVPIHPKARRPWAEALVARGVRVHPELMERFPVPGDHPEAAWLNPHRWVSREEYDRYAATRPDDDKATAMMRQMLQAMNPSMAQRISEMTDAEKAAARAAQEPQMGELFDRMRTTAAEFWARQNPEPSPDAAGEGEP